MRQTLMSAVAGLVLVATAASAAPPAADVRFATFNASLNRPFDTLNPPSGVGLLFTHLSNPNVDDQYRNQAKNVAEVTQRVRPDVLLINEFDPLQNVRPRPRSRAGNAVRDNFLEVSQNGAVSLDCPYAFIAASNTGVPTGKDLNNLGGAVTTPGAAGYGDDSFGFDSGIFWPIRSDPLSRRGSSAAYRPQTTGAFGST